MNSKLVVASVKSRLNAFERLRKGRVSKKESVKLGVGKRKIKDGGNYNN